MRRKIVTYILLIVAYFVVSGPFKVMEVIPGFADIRPVTMLGPIYAIFFGVPGCIIFALMNLVMDALSNSLAWSSIAGLLANFAGPFFIYYYWKKLSKTKPHLRTLGNALHYCIVVILMAALEALIITPSVAAFYPDVNWKLFFISVLLNTSLFPIFFGIPLSILMKEELGFKPVVGVNTPDIDN